MICGQNLNMEGMLSQITSMKSKLLAGMDLDASVLKSQLIGDLSTLKSKVRGLCPAMPSIPSLSLQTEIANLLSMNINSSAFAGQLSSITSSFGSALTSAGKDLTSLLSGLSSTDICKSIPNMEIPSGSIDVAEKAFGSLQAQIPSLKEDLSAMGDSATIADIKTELESLDSEIKGNLAAWAAELESDTTTTVT